MSRELNRDLFDEPRPARTETRLSSQVAQPAIATTEDLKIIGFHVDTLTRKIKDMESRFESFTTKFDELSSVTKLRFERIQGHFKSQAEGIQATFRDIHSKIATVAGRINERKVSDAAITGLVGRHQQVVQTFEVRLQQVQKLISEQELQLMNSRAELKEALRELEKLKRG